ncbi:hypothetical protein FRB93_013275 [Tulasnella sp. JGI-2019a]|nr:hypothetical protein FRB93_013275 [Tulasnella sp. JGI-2019a]
MFPPPTLALRNDFPVKPRLMGNLVLDQVNLWIGRSKDGSSSGLHHDFHDNLYCLLQGRKRFVLYPPSSSEHLYPNGKIDTVHSNGLISYQHLPVRADGLTPFDAAEHHLAIAKARLDAGLRRTAKPETVSKLKKEYKKARKVWIVAQGESTAVDEGERDSDDADVILRKLEAEEHRSGKGRKGASPNRSTRAGSKSNDEEWGGVLSPTTIDPAPTSTTPSDPSSFSRISTARLHAHLNLSTTAINPSPVPGQYPDLIKAEKPYVVELQPGEMLHLPASWWHEVTSTGTTLASEAPHVAFNYWFHPPDLSNRLFDEPYSDQVLWSYLRKKVRKLTSKQKWKPEWRRKRERGEGEVNTSVKKRRINRNAASVAG